eukprot:4586952-Alexandrium_andersonii.AAC.1
MSCYMVGKVTIREGQKMLPPTMARNTPSPRSGVPRAELHVQFQWWSQSTWPVTSNRDAGSWLRASRRPTGPAKASLGVSRMSAWGMTVASV